VDISRPANGYPKVVAELVATATGRAHREDPVRGRSGGPAGNARLTSWTGLVLLVLLAVEGVTLLSLGRLLGVHILVGALVVPPVLLKSATTGWRILRYYTRDHGYVQAGPPPLVLRVLGPLVVATSLAVLGTGLALVVMGSGGLRPLVGAGGVQVSMVTLHQASFIAWFAVMAVHVLSRTVPAWRTVAPGGSGAPPLPGARGRVAVLAGTLAAGLVLGLVVLGAASWWTTSWHHEGLGATSAATAPA
jgi:hypothetical protein